MDLNRQNLSRLSKDELIELLVSTSNISAVAPPAKEFFEQDTLEILELSPDALMILSPEDMHLKACNQAMLQMLELDNEKQLYKYLLQLFEERPLFYDLLLEFSSTLSEEPELSMEVEFETYEHQQRYGDLVVRKVNVLGKPFLMLRIVDLTEVKRAQMQALDSERQLEMAQQIAQTGSYIYYQKEKKFLFSKALYSLLDLDNTDPGPQSLDDLMAYVVEEDRPRLNELLKELYKEGKNVSAEFRIVSKKRAVKYFYCKVKIEFDSFGKIDKIVGTVQDITDRILTENLLRDSEQRYRLIVENTNDGVWYWDFRALKGYMSPKFEENLSFEDNQLTSESVNKWFSKVHPEERDIFRKKYDDCVKGLNDNFLMEFRYKDRQGQYIWVESGAALIRDEQQEPHYLLGTIREIQDRKQAEFQLKEQERILKMAQQVASVGSWIWDKETDSLEYSEELFNMMELDEYFDNQHIGDEVIKLVVEEDKEKVNRFVNETRALRDDEHHTMEARILVRSGKLKILRTIGRTYQRNSQGEVTKLIGTVQDITEDKARERELLEAKEQAEVSQRAKERFLQIVSHEIRNPLNAIIGITRLLEQSERSQSEQEQIATLGFSSRHLLSLINDILDTAKLQYGNIRLDKIPFCLEEQLEQTKELFRPMAEEHETLLKFMVDGQIPELLMGDPTRFNQIIFNLVSNAVKYTFRGDIVLDVRMREVQKNTVKLAFKLQDNGTGIPAEKLDQIFEAFEQFDLPEIQQKGGTGLGLYIVREMVNLMGGNIEVESDFGKGTTFNFVLPFDLPEETSRPDENRNQLQKTDLSNFSVLYVEDAHYNQLLLKGYANVWNLKLDIASDVEQALQLVQNQQYDLILTDYCLPDGTGADIAKGLENLHLREKVPIVVVSAYQLEGKDEMRNFEDYLQKPINFDKFFYILRRYLKAQNFLSSTVVQNTAEKNSNALQYLGSNHPEHFQKIIDNLVDEIPVFQQIIIKSIQEQNYRLYLQTVHKLSSALTMIQADDLLAFLQNIEDFPSSDNAKNDFIHKMENHFLEVQKKCKSFQLAGKKS